jgi:hypothetical protein
MHKSSFSMGKSPTTNQFTYQKMWISIAVSRNLRWNPTKTPAPSEAHAFPAPCSTEMFESTKLSIMF